MSKKGRERYEGEEEDEDILPFFSNAQAITPIDDEEEEGGKSSEEERKRVKRRKEWKISMGKVYKGWVCSPFCNKTH